ncbi:probable G-protein coupled receptor 160 [Silurus meridionalis]|uniref:probable G-protein coupled receptor 160 n=1 Tax=Silurus meridionalis TaxID=175797 RepID=UPI001EEBBABD|nr:probable G-protein coupled receptor 160 [Silurus meridionalis]KAI5101493.1 putative G-protein coupled receptor 160 [Silurus meridionalis]
MAQADATTLDYYFPGHMMAVLEEENETCTEDSTLQYLLLLLSKVALNTLVLSFWLGSIPKTLLGIFSISIYLADLLLICSISWAWLFLENNDTHEVVCFSLSHSATVYSLLPLPVLLAGALDCVFQQHVGFGKKSLARTVVHCMAVLLMWTLACFYSSCYTKTDLLTIQYKEGVKAFGCSVQGSVAVNNFSLNLFFIVGFVLLFHCTKLPRWVRLANRLSKHWSGSLSMSDLVFSKNLEKLESGAVDATHNDNQQDRPPLIISLVLCFALNWIPYLLMSTVCDIMGFAVPAYVSVNLLWTACANSLLVGVAFWYRSNKHGPYCTLPDDICPWCFYWYLSEENCQFTVSTELHDGKTEDSPILQTLK